MQQFKCGDCGRETATERRGDDGAPGLVCETCGAFETVITLWQRANKLRFELESLKDEGCFPRPKATDSFFQSLQNHAGESWRR